MGFFGFDLFQEKIYVTRKKERNWNVGKNISISYDKKFCPLLFDISHFSYF